jgi:hypothetical protein
VTAKQRVALVAAQYAATAREMTRAADAMASVAKSIDEAKAEELMARLRAEGLIDSEGMLTVGAQQSAPVGTVLS